MASSSLMVTPSVSAYLHQPRAAVPRAYLVRHVARAGVLQMGEVALVKPRALLEEEREGANN